MWFDVVSLIRLQQVGITGAALQWFRNYFQERFQRVVCPESTSSLELLTCGVPQGSVLGPLLFTIFIGSLSSVVQPHGVQIVLYADDIQLFLGADPRNITSSIQKLEACIDEVKRWLDQSGLFLNAAKSEFIILSNQSNSSSMLGTRLRVDLVTLEAKACVRNLGVMMDNTLTMENHVLHVTKSAFFHLRVISKIRRYLTENDAALLVQALAVSRIEFCASLLLGITKKRLKRIQKIIHYGIRVVEGGGRRDSDGERQQRRWLSVEQRAMMRLALICSTALHHGEPQQLASQLAAVHHQSHSLRSQTQGFLTVPRTRTTMGDRAWAVAAPNCGISCRKMLEKSRIEKHS